MQPAAPQPQGIDAILAALGTGGMPNGKLGQMPGPLDPMANPMPAATPAGGMVATGGGAAMPIPGMQMGATDPMGGAMNEINPQMLQMILQALLQGGAFNQAVPVG